METLPNEAILEILSRMPPKNAIQMRCICKNWRNLLSSPGLPSLHLQNFTRKEGNRRLCKLTRPLSFFEAEDCILLCDNGQSLQDSTVLLDCENGCSACFTVVGILNGVVCLAYRLLLGFEDAYIWNPIVKTKVTIPPRQDYVPMSCINLTSYESLGFGYDEANNDYKVFSIQSVREQYLKTVVGPDRFDVYSLNSRERTDIPLPSEFKFVVANATHGVFFKGFCNWVVISQKNSDDPKKCCVVSVSVSDYSFETYDLPEDISKETALLCNVADINGYFGLIPHQEAMKSVCRDVWIMKDFGDVTSWMIRYRIGRDEGPVLVWRSGLLMDPRLTRVHHREGDDVEMVNLGDDNTYIHRFTESLVFYGQGEPLECFCSL